jgi:hypothetical protein
MGTVIQFPSERAQWPTVSWVTIKGPGFEFQVAPNMLGPFAAHLRGVRSGQRKDPFFSKLTIGELDGVIESLEARIELGVN